MTRCWLITSTTYGTWLPGDARGFVSTVRNPPGRRIRHNSFGTPYDRDMPGLHRAARKSLKCPPILLSSEQAELVCAKFRETAAYRQWRLYAIAVMANHFHVVVEASAETCSSQILRDLKSYASRALTKK